MQRYYIGLIGKQGSGKNTVADILKELWYPRVMDTKEASLAYSLKKCISVLFDVDEELLFDAPSHTKNESMVKFGSIQMPLRTLMQRFGTECMRQLTDDIHIELLLSRVNRSDKQIIVVPDIRFPNEADFIRKRKGLLVKVERKVKSELGTQHASEKDVDGLEVDVVIDNNQGMDDLMINVYNNVCPLIPKYLFKQTYTGYTSVNMESLLEYVDTQVWKDISMKDESFYKDIPTQEFMSLLGDSNGTN